MMDDPIVVGRSPRMRAIFEYLSVIGPGDGAVLITGESGTGKEVVASTLHRHSPRRDKPFAAVSCALFPESLIESELFGHEAAFDGAAGARPGCFERAKGGTLFLDDIDDAPLAIQAKLLRALQSRAIERLDGSRPQPVDVRVIAGAKRDLGELVRAGRFREDLLYRLNVLTVDLPPLRERLEDVPLLVEHFLARFFARRGAPVPPISDAAMQAILGYRWPGNVRELENVCERIAESCTCGRVRVGCLGASVLFAEDGEGGEPESAPPRVNGAPAAVRLPLDEHLRRIEAQLIGDALAKTGGNKSRAAALLGIKRSTLGDRIQRCMPARNTSVG